MEIQKNEIKIAVPSGMEIDKENSTFECIKFKLIEKKLPKSWKEYCKTHPRRKGETWIGDISNIESVERSTGDNRNNIEDRNLLPNKKYAEAMLALCQLIQLRDCYNDGWAPDWSKKNFNKYVIYPSDNEIITSVFQSSDRILSFKTAKLRDQFFENFKDLIEVAKPLL